MIRSRDMKIRCSATPGNFAIHSLFASARSNRTRILPSSPLIFDHVKGEPTKPKSWKAHRWITPLNLSICLAGLGFPPTFSSLPVISLKSPMHNHGYWLWVPKDSSAILVLINVEVIYQSPKWYEKKKKLKILVC